jgi:transposase InsO family protein
VVGWAIGERMTADLVLAALNMAIAQRRPTQVICGGVWPALLEDGRAPIDGQCR